jgi:ribonuclease-3
MNQDHLHEYILNEANTPITEELVEGFLLKAGIKEKVSKFPLWQQAFINSGYTNGDKNKQLSPDYKFNKNSKLPSGRRANPGTMPLQPKSYDGLEWYGDKQLGKAVAEYLDERYPDQDEGFYTDTCSKLVRTKSLAKFARYLGFKKYLVISRHDELYCNGRERDDKLEDVFEAFLGAMHKYYKTFFSRQRADEMVYKFVVNIIQKCVDMAELIARDDNHKKNLMIYYQRNFDGKFPIYHLFDTSDTNSTGSRGSGGARIFHAYVKSPDGKEVYGEGFGKTKKEAEQQSAKNALEKLGLMKKVKKKIIKKKIKKVVS